MCVWNVCSMRKILFLLSAVATVLSAAPATAGLGAVVAASVQARDSRARMEAFRGVRQGDILPLNVIRDRIGQQMPGASLIGADLVGAVYRLRYMRGANVMIVEVDARTGRALRCTGC